MYLFWGKLGKWKYFTGWFERMLQGHWKSTNTWPWHVKEPKANHVQSHTQTDSLLLPELLIWSFRIFYWKWGKTSSNNLRNYTVTLPQVYAPVINFHFNTDQTTPTRPYTCSGNCNGLPTFLVLSFVRLFVIKWSL